MQTLWCLYGQSHPRYFCIRVKILWHTQRFLHSHSIDISEEVNIWELHWISMSCLAATSFKCRKYEIELFCWQDTSQIGIIHQDLLQTRLQFQGSSFWWISRLYWKIDCYLKWECLQYSYYMKSLFLWDFPLKSEKH